MKRSETWLLVKISEEENLIKTLVLSWLLKKAKKKLQSTLKAMKNPSPNREANQEQKVMAIDTTARKNTSEKNCGARKENKW